MTELPDKQPSKKRSRKPARISKGDDAAAVDRPIDAIVWILLGVLLIGVAGFFYLDAPSAAGADTRSGGTGVQIIFDLVYSVLGRNLAFALFAGLGALSLIGGIIGWLKKRASGAQSDEDHSHQSQN
jgi:hypothetical protein